MTKRLIVHVGLCKTGSTGSTSIQRMLFSCRNRLRADGVHVPETGIKERGSHLSHRRLISAQTLNWKHKKAKKALWKQLEKEIAVTDAQTFVVSAEDLTSPGFRVTSAELLAELAARADVEVDVVGFVRPQWQLLESEYSQRVGNGRERGTFSQFVGKMLDAGEKTILDYRVVFAPCRARFGDRVRIFPLETTQNLIVRFLTFVGIEATAIEEHWEKLHVNKRRGAKVLELHRCVWGRLYDARQPPRRALRGIGPNRVSGAHRAGRASVGRSTYIQPAPAPFVPYVVAQYNTL